MKTKKEIINEYLKDIKNIEETDLGEDKYQIEGISEKVRSFLMAEGKLIGLKWVLGKGEKELENITKN